MSKDWKVIVPKSPSSSLYQRIPEDLWPAVPTFLRSIAELPVHRKIVDQIIKQTESEEDYSRSVFIKHEETRGLFCIYSASGMWSVGTLTGFSYGRDKAFESLLSVLKAGGKVEESKKHATMNHLPTYDDFRLFESAGPLASTFKKAGFEEMTKADHQGFGGVQDGGLMYTGNDFIVLYGLSNDSKPIVSVMYGDGPEDQMEAQILNQSEQKAFVAKLKVFGQEMDRLCALEAGSEKSDGIKSWLRKYGFQIVSGSMSESVDTGLEWKDVKMGDRLEIEWEGPSNVIVSNVHGKTITLRRLGKDGKPNMSKDIHYWLEFDVDEKGYELPIVNKRLD